MSLLQTAFLTAKMTWRLVRLETDYEAGSLRSLLARLEPVNYRYARRWADVEQIRKISYALGRVLPLDMGPCLKLALVRYEQLRRKGLNVRFHLGVRPSPEGITGHAWLSLNGEPLWEDEQHVRTFRETFAYPGDEMADGKLQMANGPQKLAA